MLRRIAPITVILSLLLAAIPAPAPALSTAAEVQIGKAENRQLVRSVVIEKDPLLNAWVRGIADNLWRQVARKKVPYSIRIIQSNQINAFGTEGGYIYVYDGMLDFVQSDDELAGVLGHETGHIERRNVVTYQAKSEILGALFSIAALFSPIIYNFGNIAEAGLLAKMSRVDELQADRYGLQLMARAGYDPEAMITMMRHLGVLNAQHNDLVSNYLASHPPSNARVAHLMGYPELDPTKVTTAERLVRALSDEERARYDTAARQLTKVLKTEPDNPEALLKLAQAQVALGLINKSEQTLALAAQFGTDNTKRIALDRIAALQQMQERSLALHQPDLTNLRTQMTGAQTRLLSDGAQITLRAKQGAAQLRAVNRRLHALQYEIPNFSNVNVRKDSRLAAITHDLTTIARAINSAMEQAQDPINGVGTLSAKKSTGLIAENAAIYKKMQAPLALTPIPRDSLAVLPEYPTVLHELGRTDDDMLRGVDAARASLLLMDSSINDLDTFLRQFSTVQINAFGDISQPSYDALMPQLRTCYDHFDRAASAASQAAQLYNMARSRQLAARITLLGVGTSAERYATLQYALRLRFNSGGIAYQQMRRQKLTPGQVAAATIIAADTKSTPQQVIDAARAAHLSIVDEGNARGMESWPLEIFMGLVYLDYTDDPLEEVQG
ncbi:MAG: M48 family metalloprotease [Bacillati bacterium]